MKKVIALLLTLVLLFAAALPASAIIYGDEGDEFETFGIAEGYVRTKEVIKSEESTRTITRAFNKQGKLVSETDVYVGEGYTEKTAQKLTYDKKGNLTKEIYYFDDNVSTTIYTYNQAGNPIKEVCTISYEDNTSTTTSKVYTYDKNGNKIKEVSYGYDCVATTTYTYDGKGQLTKESEISVYEDNSKYTNVTTYAYDKNGNEIKRAQKTTSPGDGSSSHTVTSVYNDKGQLVKCTDVSTYGSSTTREVIVYTYDKNGNKIKEVDKQSFPDNTKATMTTTSTYDADGHVIKEVCVLKSAWSTSKTIITCVYDSAGRLKKETNVYKDSDGAEKTVKMLAYDKAGNLKKVTISYSPTGDGIVSKTVTTYAYQKIGA